MIELINDVQLSTVLNWPGSVQHDNPSRLYDFLQDHFIHWLEALSLIGKKAEAVLMIKTLGSIPAVSGSNIFLYVVDTDPTNL